MYSMQLNHLPDSLRQKIAPSDSRFRTDMRAWEEGEHKLAEKEKNRLEEN